MANTHYRDGYQVAENMPAGTELSASDGGRVVDALESNITHPTHSDGFADKGDVCLVGNLVGVARSGANAATQTIPIDTAGIWVLSAEAVDDSGNSAIAMGDVITVEAATALLSKKGNPDTQKPFGIALSTLTGGTTGVIAVWVNGTVAGVIQGSAITPISFFDGRVWDNLAALLPAAAANDDLGLIVGTFLTDAPTIQGSDVGATTATQKARFQRPLPSGYIAGESVVLRLNANALTTVADDDIEVDIQAVEPNAPTVDICATAIQSINSLVADDYDFVLTPTNLVAGDLIDIVVTIVATDAGNAGAGIAGVINNMALLLSEAA